MNSIFSFQLSLTLAFLFFLPVTDVFSWVLSEPFLLPLFNHFYLILRFVGKKRVIESQESTVRMFWWKSETRSVGVGSKRIENDVRWSEKHSMTPSAARVFIPRVDQSSSTNGCYINNNLCLSHCFYWYFHSVSLFFKNCRSSDVSEKRITERGCGGLSLRTQNRLPCSSQKTHE